MGLRLLGFIMHLIVSIWNFVLGLVTEHEIFLIFGGCLKRYRALDISKVRCLAVVVDSEALQTRKVLDLSWWLASIGLKNICLYDTEGYGTPELGLMLIYGPAWRIRYSEIVHIGPLKFGALIKAIHGLTLVHQNSGA